MAISRTSDGTLVIGNLSTGERALEISESEDAGHVAVLHWVEEGVGLDISLDDALAVRDELNAIIDRARAAGEA